MYRFVILAFGFIFTNQAFADFYTVLRGQLVREIERDVIETSSFLGKRTLSSVALSVMKAVPRHEFVSKYYIPQAYKNRPLPIGFGQTISQPYIVAIMTDLIDPKPTDRVLEIGTGSGYQAAVLASIVSEVHSIEIIPGLHTRTKKLLKKLGYENIFLYEGDGYFGVKESAPYDAIVVTAALDHVPPSLIRQLKPGGKMIIPVGGLFTSQMLILVNKDLKGKVRTKNILPVRFVPFTRKK